VSKRIPRNIKTDAFERSYNELYKTVKSFDNWLNLDNDDENVSEQLNALFSSDKTTSIVETTIKPFKAFLPNVEP
jgi:hypothetical protein